MTHIPPAERMADDIDRAAHHDEAHLARALANHRAAARAAIQLNGRCHNCHEVTGSLWCCSECREDWERRAGRG